MDKVTQIDWTIKTHSKWWSGTDTRIDIKILRDNTVLKHLKLEPGNTPRLNRNELATYFWIFQNPDGLGTSVSGTVVPFFETFPQGIRGHLKVQFIAKGNDAWEKDFIDSTVHTGDLAHVPGTIDSVVWQEQFHSFFFGRDIVLSTDNSEGFTTLTINY